MARKKSTLKTASSSYQDKFLEVQVEYAQLSQYTNEDSISYRLENDIIDPKIDEIRKKLIALVLEMASKSLTKHQSTVLKYTLEGKTQAEIGTLLNISQSAVHKALHGNLDYQNKNDDNMPKRYGGTIAKLQKLCKKNVQIQLCLKQIEEIKNNK